jgi:translation initiation factor 2-alpha kinase 4
VREGFDELQAIVTLCLQLGIKSVKIAPLLATNYDFHKDGLLFESAIVKGRNKDVIAAGGR